MRVSVRVSYVTPERKNTAGMKGFARRDCTFAIGLMPPLCEIQRVCSTKYWFQGKVLVGCATMPSYRLVAREICFTLHSISHKRGKRRILDGVADQPFQPSRHRVFFERGPVQAGFDLELSVESDDADD